MHVEKTFEGRVVVVTGAGSGIGRATALRFAAAGAAVLVADISGTRAARTVDEIVAESGHAVATKVDVSDGAQVEAMIATAVRELGGVDVLVNNAATVRPGDAITLDEVDWDIVWRTNVSSVFLGAKYAAPHMAPGSSIISTASTEAFSAEPDLVCYGATKSAVVALTRSLAVDLGPRGIRANCICPGITLTPAMAGYMADDGVRGLTEAVLPARRLGRPDDIAGAAVWLAGPDSAYVTGQAIVVDGGLTATSGFAITQRAPSLVEDRPGRS